MKSSCLLLASIAAVQAKGATTVASPQPAATPVQRPMPNDSTLFGIAMYPTLAALVWGLVIGWLFGKQKRREALVGGAVLAAIFFLGYCGLFEWIGMFDIKNEIR